MDQQAAGCNVVHSLHFTLEGGYSRFGIARAGEESTQAGDTKRRYPSQRYMGQRVPWTAPGSEQTLV
ncbi:MAG TPA: hypothetical protein VGS41_18880 [Chthonomonadales bacterium]|nr:hypothetical protein [Chthonomonadales bacterium]